MMSPRQVSEDLRGGSSQFRHTPLQIIHIIGNFMRIWSVYSMYHYLNQTGAPVILFLFCCLVPASILFLILQKPWKGRPLSNQQVVPSIINGGITALYFIMWGKGLKSCGPVRAILAEYSGAVLGVLSAVLYGRRGHLWKKTIFKDLREEEERREEDLKKGDPRRRMKGDPRRRKKGDPWRRRRRRRKKEDSRRRRKKEEEERKKRDPMKEKNRPTNPAQELES